MAVALEKLEDQLNCSICLDIYTNPKQLQCHHTYCQKCLVKLVYRDQQGQLSVTCPSCRQATPVPSGGVAGLQTAFQVNKFLEIVEEHKKAKLHAESAPSIHPGVSISCPEHGGKEVDLYCETCGETICWKCIMKEGGRHHSHDYQELSKAYEKYKKEIMPLLQPVKKQLSAIEKTLIQYDTRCLKISEQQSSIEAEIENAFMQLHETLNDRRAELIGQLQQLTQSKLKGLAAQRGRVEATQAQLYSCVVFMKESLEADRPSEVMVLKSTTVKQVKELTNTFQQDLLEPRIAADMTVSGLSDLSAMCCKYGRVFSTETIDPSKCHLRGNGISTLTKVGQKYTALFETVDIKNKPCQVPETSISCELIAEVAESRVRGSVEKKAQNNQYEISYEPTVKGRHLLCIKVEGKHIRGSPFSFSARSSVEVLGAFSRKIFGLESPSGIAVTHAGEIVITQCSEHCVTVLSPEGERLLSFGVCGTGEGEFQLPCGVAVDAVGNILVADRDNHRIQMFGPQGNFLKAVGTHGNGPLQFHHPHGIACSASNGRVYVASDTSIQILNLDLSYCGTFGKVGKGKGQFDIPWDIACDSSGKVYVSDYGNHRIQVFTAEGKFLRMFGTHGSRKGELIWPKGVAVDYAGNVYVGEWGNSRLSVFSSEGLFITVCHCMEVTPGRFGRVAVDSCGVVYACDSSNNHIKLF